VEPGVSLEVLDWGGSGKPMLLLTGSGNGARVRRFRREVGCHRPCLRNYAAGIRRIEPSRILADDVLHVLDPLKLVAPVLVAHSMGGNELTAIASQHPHRVSGLVYLDAGADPKDFPASDPTYMAPADKLPPANRLPPPSAFPESERRASTAGYQSAIHSGRICQKTPGSAP